VFSKVNKACPFLTLSPTKSVVDFTLPPTKVVTFALLAEHQFSCCFNVTSKSCSVGLAFPLLKI
jgi:hypothetical protein